jgi:NitT/TauT family transport system substrate-binding protein
MRIPAVLAVLLAGLAACGPGATTGNSSPGASASITPTKVLLGQVGGISDGAIFIANDKGYFREQGIELDAKRFDSAALMVAPLGVGQLDVGAGAPSAGLMNAAARDIPLKIVADKGSMTPGHGYEAMVVRKQLFDSGKIKTAADLKDKTIAISARNISPEVTLDAYLRTGGLTIKDVKIATMAHADMRAALANGAIDMAVPIEPFVTQIAEGGIGVILTRNDAVAPNTQVAVVLYGPDFVSKKPDVAKRFMVAYLKGARYYNDAFTKNDPVKRRDAIAILIANTPVKDPALYQKMIMPGIDPNGRVSVLSLAQLQDWFLEKGSQKVRMDLNKVVDLQYAELAVKQLGPYR